MASAIALKGAVFLEISFVCKCSSSFKVGCFFQSSIFQISAVFRNAKVRPLKTFCVVLNKKKYVIYQCKFGTPKQHKILGNVDFQFLRLGPVKGKVVSLLGHFFSLQSLLHLKVSKFQNEFMISSFLPKNKRNFLRISALASKKSSDQKNKGTLYH